MSDVDLASAESSPEIAENQGDRWTFVAVLPDSSFIHTLHHGDRTVENAKKFIEKIKEKSDGEAPLFSSDDWFYEQSLLHSYGVDFQPPYKGRGRRPLPIRVAHPKLKYVQVRKKRDSKGKIIDITFGIVYGEEAEIDVIFASATRCKTINTVFVESRNGKFRKDDARLIRKTLCHSKKAVYHDAHADLTAQVMNYTRVNNGLKVLKNQDAALFEQKYQHLTPAMAEGLIDKLLTIKELLIRRPQKITIN